MFALFGEDKLEVLLINFFYVWPLGSSKMWSDSPRQPKEGSDDERSYSRMLCCLQNTRWVWFVCDCFCS